MKNYICKGCGEEINPYFNSTCSYCGTENPVMTKPKMPKIESAYGESPLVELYKYYQMNKRIFLSYLMNEGKDEEKKKPNFPKEIGGLHASDIWIDEFIKFEYFNKIKPKENKMLKVISDVYEKTSDAVLVEKYFGNYFCGDSPMHGVLMASLKKEILEKAKELEKAENDKKV